MTDTERQIRERLGNLPGHREPDQRHLLALVDALRTEVSNLRARLGDELKGTAGRPGGEADDGQA